MFVRRIAIPQDHGSWVFLLSPLFIGLFTAGKWSPASGLLILASLAGFLIRQPATIVVKVHSGRRPRRELEPAFFWMAVYTTIVGFALAGLIYLGYEEILLLALPGVIVFAWHLLLISKRSERRQIGVEVVASGVLALAAPAAFWVGKGWADPTGWWLFILTWLQSAASIVFAYLRLAQREMVNTPDIKIRLSMARRALLYTSFNLVMVAILSIAGHLPALLPLPYALQWFETIRGTLQPAIGEKPTRIGIRQLIISTLFTLLFILTW